MLVQDIVIYCQGAIATTMTQPLDVLKTRAMNAKPGEFNGALDLIRFTARGGLMSFYKVNNQHSDIIDMRKLILYLSGIYSSICEIRTSNHIDICIF